MKCYRIQSAVVAALCRRTPNWLFVSTPSTLTTALAVIGFELRFQLIELGLLLRRQHGQHLLTELNSRAHQLGLEACHLGQFLSSQRFVERTAFTRLALRSIFKQVFVAMRVNQPSIEPRPAKLFNCAKAFRKVSWAASSA